MPAWPSPNDFSSPLALVFYDTGTLWEWTAGADFTLTRTTSLTLSYHSDFGLGAGVLIRF